MEWLIITVMVFITTSDQTLLRTGQDADGVPLTPELSLAIRFRVEKKRLLQNVANELVSRIKAQVRGGARRCRSHVGAEGTCNIVKYSWCKCSCLLPT